MSDNLIVNVPFEDTVELRPELECMLPRCHTHIPIPKAVPLNYLNGNCVEKNGYHYGQEYIIIKREGECPTLV